MENNFIYANELKKRYSVWGSFYKLKIDEYKILCCRNDLRIFDKAVFKTYTINTDIKPDALVIMMNPGSSKPINDTYEIPIFGTSNLSRNLLKNLIVPTKPDTAQYQIMRVAFKQKWGYIKVVNLLDIREPKSEHFKQILNDLKNKNNGTLPSIFSKDRLEERNEILKSLNPDTPIICAWGTANFLEDYARKCMECLPLNAKIIGVNYTGNPYLYYHASPHKMTLKKQWVNDIIKRLDE